LVNALTQDGALGLFDVRIGEEQIAFEPVKIGAPFNRVVVKMINGHGGNHVGSKVSVAGEEHCRGAGLGIDANKIAEIFVVNIGESVGLGSRIARTSQMFHGHQLVGNHLKNAIGEIELALHEVAALDVFHGATGIGGNLHLEPALMIVSEHVEGEPGLAEIIEALDLLGAHFAAIEHREEHRGQNDNDGNDDEQLDEGESPASLICPRGRFHGDAGKAKRFVSSPVCASNFLSPRE